MKKFPALCEQKYSNGTIQLFVALPSPENQTKTKRYYLGPDNSTTRTLYESLQSLYDDEDWGLSKAQIAQLLSTGAHKGGKRALLKAAEALVSGRPVPPPTSSTTKDNHPNGILLVDLFRRFIAAKKHEWHTNPSGYQTAKAKYKLVIKKKLKKYHKRRVKEFTKAALMEWRAGMVQAGLKRTTVNTYVLRLLTVMKWGAENELVPMERSFSLASVKPLKTARGARESVKREVVEATLPELPDKPQTVIKLLLLTAARPTEILSLRLDRINKSDPETWLYEPEWHKNKRYDITRLIPLNPEAQQLITEYVERNNIKGPYVFLPRSVGGKKKTRTPYYVATSLTAMVVKAAKRAKVEPWSPYQIRHLVATELLAAGKIQEAQYLLGHTSIKTTEAFYFDQQKKVDKAKDAVKGLSLGDK